MKFLRYAILAVAFAATALPAAADPNADIARMQRAYAGVKSWHAEMQLPKGRTVTIDAVMPDKFHEKMAPTMEAVIIGSGMWINTNGRWMKLPFAMPQMRSMIDMARQQAADPAKASEYTTTFVGPAMLNGVATRHYRMVHKGDNKPVDLWLGSNHLPAQMQVQSDQGPVTIVYSLWNAVPDITPPM